MIDFIYMLWYFVHVLHIFLCIVAVITRTLKMENLLHFGAINASDFNVREESEH